MILPSWKHAQNLHGNWTYTFPLQIVKPMEANWMNHISNDGNKSAQVPQIHIDSYRFSSTCAALGYRTTFRKTQA